MDLSAVLPFALTIFCSAFLLFLVQPLIAKFILPWFGGTPAVWTTCMLFFQAALLAGYAYAHLIVSRLTLRRQVVVHVALLAVALLLLPITPGDHWKPPDDTSPLWRIVVLLSVCLGLPYLTLSATGPLMQAWFSRVYPGTSAYRLYALSNAGSLLALVSYPFFVEPNSARRTQAGGWSLGLAAFALPAAWCGLIVWKHAGRAAPARNDAVSGETMFQAGDAPPPVAVAPRSRWLWFVLPACASVLLLAVTNKICQDIAVIPFLWVLPLSLYLLSFIVCFDSPRWYWRVFWLPLLAMALGVVLWVSSGSSVPVPSWVVLRPLRWLLDQVDGLSMFKTIGVYLATLFICCMVCHGELYRLRPAARDLTGYYLLIAAGGAFGGLFVAALAPLLFKGYFELQAGLVAVALLAAAVLFVDPGSPLRHGRWIWAWAVIVPAVLGLGAGFYFDAAAGVQGAVELSRSFYGVLKVSERSPEDPNVHAFLLQHGGTVHGLQLVSADKRRLPTTYYTATSGIGLTMEHFPRQTNRRVGVVGLGAGTIAAWGKPGDCFRFYDINSDVLRLARRRFSYVGDSPATVEVVLGDARLSLEREPDQRFDILALDAFSSDAIPVHLLTQEAFEIYRRHLRLDGVIAVHISNRYLDLEPIVRLAADHFGWSVARIYDRGPDSNDVTGQNNGAYASDWMLLTRNEEFLGLPAVAKAASTPDEFSPKIKMWTDEKSDLFRILILNNDGWLAWLRRVMP